MFRYGLALTYFCYLVVAATTMAGGLHHSDHPSARALQSNLCTLLGDNGKCG